MATVTDQSLEQLPAPVARSLRRSGVIGRPIPSTVDLRQVGEILLRDRWFPFTAVESYRVDTPAFEWRGTVGMFGLPLAKARDTLADGRGRMHVRLLRLKTIVDESGPEMDQGSLMRWLNETMWFPHVWATPLISWTSIDGNSARGSVTAGATTAEAEFVFDDDGRLVDFRADRYRATDQGMVRSPWATPITGHAAFDQVEVPSEGRALWLPDDEYIRIRLTGIRYG